MDANDLQSLREIVAAQAQEMITERRILNARMDKVLEALRENTATEAEIILLYDNLKGAFRVLHWVYVGATWITKVSTAIGITWMLWKFVVMEAIYAKTKG